MIYFVIYTAIMTALFCYFRAKKTNFASMLFKTLASLGFVSMAVFASVLADKSYTICNAYIIFGTILGLLGDILLDAYSSRSEKVMLFSGIFSFMLGHISYLLAIIALCKNIGYTLTFGNIVYAIILSLILSATFALGSKLLNFKYHGAFVPAVIYIEVITFIMVLSFTVAVNNVQMIYMSIGLTLFWLSDILLSFRYFGNKRNSNLFQILNHILYYAGQIIIVFTLFRI